MDYDKLFTSSPINKQAARVTYSEQELESERSALVAQVQYLGDAIKTAKKHRHISPTEVAKMGAEKLKIQERLQKIKGVQKDRKKSSVEFYFMEICRENMTKYEFHKYWSMACDKRGDIYNKETK